PIPRRRTEPDPRQARIRGSCNEESRMRSQLLLSIAMLAALSACKRDGQTPATAPTAPAAAAAPGHAFAAGINAADFSELVKTLSSDEFEGRAPGSAGEDKTVEYLRA